MFSRQSVVQWACPVCGGQEESGEDALDKAGHLVGCARNQGLEAASKSRQEKEAEKRKADPNTQEFHCSDCDTTLYLTPMQWLRHKKTHSSKDSS